MLAVYDYNSREDSPNRGMELELSFKSGDTITVYGGMVSYVCVSMYIRYELYLLTWSFILTMVHWI